MPTNRFVLAVLLSVLTLAQTRADEPTPVKVTEVPAELREEHKLDPFYKKYTSAGGIPVLSSDKVSDEALIEAVYLIRQMLGERDDILKAMVKNKVRFVVMAPTEMTTDVPEQRDMKPKDYWDARARGLGGRLTSCGEENLLNLKGDRYRTENILIHEFSHAIHRFGIGSLDRKFDSRLQEIYKKAMDNGTWKDTYAATNHSEYWAEGVQAYFDCAAPPVRGVHNDINTREKLEKADPDLFALIDETFKKTKWRYVRYDKREKAENKPKPPAESPATAKYAPSAEELQAAYQRAAQAGRPKGNVYKATITAHWYHDNTRFWYRNDLAGGTREFRFAEADTGAHGPAFDHKKLAASLSKASGKEYKADRLPFDSLTYVDDDHIIRFKVGSTNWKCDLTTYECISEEGAKPAPADEKPSAKPPADPDANESLLSDGFAPDAEQPVAFLQRQPLRDRAVDSPDGNWTALVKDNNIFLRNSGGKETVLTTDGKADLAYGRLSWSPDSKVLVAFRIEPGDEKQVHLIESSPKDGGRAKLESRGYPLPGDKFTTYELHLFDPATDKEIKCAVDKIDFGVPSLRWQKEGHTFTYQKTDRGHQRFRLIEVDALTGKSRNLIDEKTDTFIWSAHTQRVAVTPVTWLEKTDEIIYASERDGWRHLYLIDAKSGKIKNTITPGEYVVRAIDRIDEQKRQVWFRANGKNADQDPYFIHYYRVNFDGSDLVALTEANGNHTIAFSPDRKYLIDTYSRVDRAPLHELRRASDGKGIICNLDEADISELRDKGWEAPEVFVAKGRDGKTDIWGVIYRPPNLDPTKKYPVIESIYAGPHDSHVPKTFNPVNRFASLTELGFIVVQIDGMGTANRSKAFHDVCWKNLKDAGFPDRILWHQAAAKKYPYYDISRVGIFGTSAGGQSSTGALLFHGDFYKAAVSACGCHDNRMDKASWNEQWMGYPVGPQYAASSNIDNAVKLKGKLLLIVGELDHNVPPESTLRLADALIKAGKDFDFLMVPGMGHSNGGAYGNRRLQDFFVRHLHGVEPPDRNARGG
jgi:dipeptidyl aminopeptidase/acylaminoacyl peptidase